jgi:hypothetical protein
MAESLKRTILLWTNGPWFEHVSVSARPIKKSERSEDNASRFIEDRLVADIVWEAGEKRTTQSTRLQPMNALELRAFGVACIELAGEMERDTGKG